MKKLTIIASFAVVALLVLAAGNQASAGVCGSVHVDNHSPYHVELYYNSFYLGCLDPGQCGEFRVDDHSHSFMLRAYRDCGHGASHLYRIQRDCGDYRTYDWTISGCRHH
jgi:hypothetical protein